jgi:hypothetical protein
MGDRTTVSIQIKESDWVALAKKYDEGNETKFESRVGVEENEFFEDGIVHVTCHEVNYAEWNTLEDLLKNEKVPYDKSWGAGGEYRGGHAYYRNVGGEYRGYEMYEGEDEAIADLEYALECIKKYPPDLAASIVEGRIKMKKPFIPTPLNESNSIVFIKDLVKEEVGES